MKKDTRIVNAKLDEDSTTLRNRLLLGERFSNSIKTIQAVVIKSNGKSIVKSALEELNKFRIIGEVNNTDE